jgi:capsular exopolysaccharide synthesis family protein
MSYDNGNRDNSMQETFPIWDPEGVAFSPELASNVSSRANGSRTPSANTLALPGDGAQQLENYLRFDDIRKQCAHMQWRLDPQLNVFFDSHNDMRAAEQFRTLRSRLYQFRADGEHPLHKLLVTSAIPAEGKTFVTCNLAQAIARQTDRRVLMIDADLRCPQMHMSLGAPASPGLTDFLRGEADEMAVVQSGLEGNICFIPSGRAVSDASELLSNGRLQLLLDRFTPVFDWIILDSPPCLPVADSAIVANLCDGVLMVVRAGSTPPEFSQKACQKFRDRNLIGVVLNRSEESRGYGSYYYGGSENTGQARGPRR